MKPTTHPHIATVTTSARKGDVVKTRWTIRQEHPYPRVEGNYGSLNWGNLETLRPDYHARERGVKPTIAKHYTASLLRPDFDPEQATGNRQDLAGWDGNAAPLSLRGASLGEVDIRFRGHYEEIKVRGFGFPTPGEAKWIREQIIPQIQAYIDEQAFTLHAAAVGRVRARFEDELTKARASLLKMEQEAAEMVAAIA